jgi:two-component system response regulator YesN
MIRKVLLVDDELLVRNHIRSLLNWEQHGLNICGEAQDGREAIDMIENCRPDIVILDIHMPVMNGVALAQYIHEHYKAIKTIVLSSYDSYDYVRETLNFGAVDYLLKHRMDQKTLLYVIGKATNQINEGIRAKEENERFMKKWEIINPTLLQHCVKEHVLGAADARSDSALFLKDLQMELHDMVVLVMQIVDFELATERHSEKDKNLFLRSILNLCQQTIGDYKHGCAVYLDHGTFVLLLSFTEYRSEQTIHQMVYSYEQKLEKTLQLFFGLTTVFGYSAVFHQTTDIHKNYESARAKIHHIHVGESNHPVELSGAFTIHHEKKLLTAIGLEDHDEVSACIDGLFRALHPEDNGSLRQLMNELLNFVRKIGDKTGVSLRNELTDMVKWMSTHYSDREEMKTRIKKIYFSLVDNMENQVSGNARTNYVQETIQYIYAYYKEPISLENAADRTGITASYLSRLFKEETQTSFTEFLNKVRIDAGKQLMENGGYKIKDLYTKIGFNNYSYFIKVFKDIVGVPPLTYLRQMKRKP